MKRAFIPIAAILASILAAPSFAGSLAVDHGQSDPVSYQFNGDQDVDAPRISTKGKAKTTDAFKDFNRKFGSPHPNFESGRR